MNIFKRIASLWTLSPEAKQVQQELQQKVYMPEEPDYTADVIAERGFTSLNDHQLVDYRYRWVLPFEKRVVEIDPKKPIEAEMKRARNIVSTRAHNFRKRAFEIDTRLTRDWNLQAVDADAQDELDSMAEALTNAKPKTKRWVH